MLEAILAVSSPKPRLVFTPRGEIVWASATAERLLDAAPPGTLASLRAAAARVERGRKAIDLPPGLDEENGFGAHLSLLPSASGTLILVELDPRAPATADDDLQRRFGITRAEALVLAELGAGRANPVIAARLHLSVETVRTTWRASSASSGSTPASRLRCWWRKRSECRFATSVEVG